MKLPLFYMCKHNLGRGVCHEKVFRSVECSNMVVNRVVSWGHVGFDLVGGVIVSEQPIEVREAQEGNSQLLADVQMLIDLAQDRGYIVSSGDDFLEEQDTEAHWNWGGSL